VQIKCTLADFGSCATFQAVRNNELINRLKGFTTNVVLCLGYREGKVIN
jgi:hypothetical protein